ncbi:SPW repeat protein [Nocardia sp. NPDC058518]|uniref:SPW repeat domain-containing protein n=1 Tax=Nocardia sp. NPDC058518 TaxID=3346534 RepID=UPI00365F5F55
MRATVRTNTAGWTAFAVGIGTAVTPAWASTTPAGAAATGGLGVLTAVYAAWSLIARDPTKDHWALSVVGIVLFMTPWVGGFAADTAAWVAWIAGALVMAAGGTAYVRDEAANTTQEARIEELVTYRLQHHDRTASETRG